MGTLGDGFTLQDLRGLKYVIVKATLKKDATVSVRGLFYGYRPLVDAETQIVTQHEMFLWLVNGNDVHILNALHYKIDHIVIGRDTATTYSAMEENRNIKRLEAIIDALKIDKKTEPSGLVDLTKYDIPKEVANEINEPSITASKKSVGTASPSTTSVYNNYDDDYYFGAQACGYTPPNYGSTYKRKKVSTAVIKRTTKYPISNAVERMRAKVELLRQGKYKPPKLKSGKKEPKKKQQQQADSSQASGP